ncbi:DNA primase [uncultured Amnibacterium sp.]|uniref:DNA primase n=1 Tax=uncultured Amnibacterium sp. TaxID=1631851 RepID=UPI0035C96834
MAGRIRNEDIEAVRSRINIADVIGEQVTLKRAGVDSLKGLCPFHEERSPSFHVRPQGGYFHCFGCGEGGDAIAFLMKFEHVTFAEAVERLAQRIGFQLTYEDGGPARDTANRVRLIEANRVAAEFFAANLDSAGAAPGREFLTGRGFDAQAASRFGLGWAPKSWDELTRHLRGKGFDDAELQAAGLVSAGDRGVYDRFRGRLVWPVRDLSGAVLGFGARRLLEDDQGPKYLNTPETAIYHKAQLLYGLDLAKRDVARGHRVVVVEGYTDVMACHLAGVTTAVATCGTAFGVEHIRVLRRVLGDDNAVPGEVIFTFDPDAAGQQAAVRAFAEERRFSAQTYIAVGADGLDPSDLRSQHGDAAVRAMVQSRKPMFEFMLRRVLEQHDLDAVEGRVAALRAGAPIIADIRDPQMKTAYTRELAKWLAADVREVELAVTAARRDGARRDSAGADGARSDGARSVGARGDGARHSGTPDDRARDRVRDDRPGDAGDRFAAGSETGRGDAQQRDGAPDRPPETRRGPRPTLRSLPQDPAARLETEALMVILQFPNLVGDELIARATDSGFSNASLAAIRDAVAVQAGRTGGPGWLERVAGELPGQIAPLVEELAVAPLPARAADDTELTAYVQSVVRSLVVRDVLRLKVEVLQQLRRSESVADPERRRALNVRLVQLESDRRMLLGV